MTIEECRKMLGDMRRAKARAKRMRNELEEMQGDIAALALKSALNGTEGHGNAVSRPVERIVERIQQRQEAFAAALDEAFAIEDKLADAIRSLTPEEQDVIIECYMRGTPMRKIAGALFMSERTAYRLRGTATRKIAERDKRP